MSDTRFMLVVKRGVEYTPMEGLSEYELRTRIDTFREWFGLDADDFGVQVDGSRAQSEEVNR